VKYQLDVFYVRSYQNIIRAHGAFRLRSSLDVHAAIVRSQGGSACSVNRSSPDKLTKKLFCS